jgi:putative membrane protein
LKRTDTLHVFCQASPKKNLMKKLLGWVLAITVVVAGACDDDDNDSTSLGQADQDFVLKASEANLAEIELGELAATKSTTPSVKAFGEMMVAEHQVALDELDSIAGRKNASMTRELNSEHEQVKATLTGLVGYSFDSAYMHSQVKDHEKAIALFETQSSNGIDPDVTGYATKYLPHIQMHHHKADSIVMTLNK